MQILPIIIILMCLVWYVVAISLYEAWKTDCPHSKTTFLDILCITLWPITMVVVLIVVLIEGIRR